METPDRLCAVCGGAGAPDNPLCDDGYEDGVWLHLHCYNSDAARQRHVARQAADPVYARYARLMSRWVPVTCPGCQASLMMEPKAVGMGAGSWPVNCMRCHRVGPRWFSGYVHCRLAYDLLESMRGRFVRSQHLGIIDDLVRAMACTFDHFVDRGPCVCGGRFSLAAKPRCPRCDAEVFDTYFNLVREPLTAAQKKRMDELFGVGWDE